MGQIFLSHSTNDSAIARALQRALGDLGQEVWIDSRELRGGDPLWPDIQRAIEDAQAYIVLISPSGLQSSWVGKEFRHALSVQKQRGKDVYPVIPVSLDGTELGVLEVLFDDTPLYIPLSSGAGGIEAALDAILIALGRRAPADVATMRQPPAESIEELVLELTDLKLEQIAVARYDCSDRRPGIPGSQPARGVRDVLAPEAGDEPPATEWRATARARLVYEPATPGQPAVTSTQSWRFIAPLGQLEADDLRWYLEKYAIWPGGPFCSRAAQIENNLVVWGKLLYNAAIPAGPTHGVLRAWARIDAHAERRFSVQVDATSELGASAADVAAAREAATRLLGLPWELLHDDDSFLFQGARPTRVRRRLPNTQPLDVAVVATPIRILLISPRPENDACSYIDHRISALPLVDATEKLPGLVELHILTPPTLPALREELDRADRARQPYHVIHFDGHGIYDRRVGLGGLCFELPEDDLARRRHQTIYTDQLGPLLRDHRIPLVFLGACQTAQAEQAPGSVASELLLRGVASVVAMSHGVLIETARRFVTAFYAALARGARVGAAVLEGQRHLKDDTVRDRIFGAGELRLEDWFVPVLFQEKADPQLFRRVPARQTREDFQAALRNRLGALPPAPSTGFVGRSRDLLALERLLSRERYAVLRGQGGEGKTALAAEFARWIVRSQRFRRAAFVSVEVHGTAKAALDVLGRQLAGASYSVATFASLELAEQPVARALREQPTLLVIDNLESILPPPYLADDTPEIVAAEVRDELAAILALCDRLHRHGETRVVFTSREALPTPFDGDINRHELHRLHPDDAVKLVERVVNEGATTGRIGDVERAAIEELVEAVHGHARTLALLAPSLHRLGVTATRESLVELMAGMNQRFPGQRENSLFASVELSLRRLSPDNRQRVRVLGVFHGGVDLEVLRAMTEWDVMAIASLACELLDTGLATRHLDHHILLDPALCPYLRNLLEGPEREALTARWVTAMREELSFLRRQRRQNPQLAAIEARLELANLLALLAQVSRTGDHKATVYVATDVRALLAALGLPLLMARVSEVRDAAAARIDTTENDVRFHAELSRIQGWQKEGRLHEALASARALIVQTRAIGEQAYPGASSDLAAACAVCGDILKDTGSPEEAMLLLDEAKRRFEALERVHPSGSAAAMLLSCSFDRGDCLTVLGRIDEAAATYEECIRRAQELQNQHMLAVVKGQLGILRVIQHRHQDALDAQTDAREYFTRIGDLTSVATSWRQIGGVHHVTGQFDAAEDAYRQSLAISVRLNDLQAQAHTLDILGLLYEGLGRMQEAASLFRIASEHAVSVGDIKSEGERNSQLARTLIKLGHWDEARTAIHRAIECHAPLGDRARPWEKWAMLGEIETGAGNVDKVMQAYLQAFACYLAHQREGGENRHPDGRSVLAAIRQLLTGDAGMVAEVDGVLAVSDLLPSLRGFTIVLRAIAADSRARRLADAPEPLCRSAAELMLLLDALEAAEA